MTRMPKSRVLLTGAAGKLGLAFAQAFVREGASVWLADSSRDGLAAAKAGVPTSQLLGTLCFDITQPAQVKEAFAEISLRSGGLDVLVNNAGIGVFSPFWERDYDEFMMVLNVNVGGTFLCTREALLLMKTGPGGSIINVGSVYGVVSSDPRIYTDCARMNSEVYSASKAGVIQMTKYFSVHAAPFNVRVNCVSPGGVFNNQGDDFVKNYADKTPMQRMAKDSEICGAAVFLASAEAQYITGQNIVVDGGFSAW